MRPTTRMVLKHCSCDQTERIPIVLKQRMELKRGIPVNGNLRVTVGNEKHLSIISPTTFPQIPRRNPLAHALRN